MKIINLYKQFGFVVLLKRICLALVRKVFKLNRHTIYCVQNHVPKVIDSNINVLDKSEVLNWFKDGRINESEKTRFFNFLDTDCIGFYIEIETELAAWGFIQTKGSYQYGKYFYQLPNEVYMLKNLFVAPKFRGRSLGKIINEIRINSIPKSCIPCGFVIPENRYAIRNLEMYGFTKQVYVKDYLWLNRFHSRKLKVIGNKEVADVILTGFDNE